MAKKKTVSKKPKTNGVMSEIMQLHNCIAKDQAELSKLLKKAVTESSKKVIAFNKAQTKAKKALGQAIKNKKKDPKNHMSAVSLLQSIKIEMATEKTTLALLKNGIKKFNEQQKALKQVDKRFFKSAKSSVKAKRKPAKKSRTAKNNSESVFSDDSNTVPNTTKG